MYIGAYDDEPPAIARMHAYIRENGYTPRGKHHEIYLSDMRKVAPEKNRTILRQPVKRVWGLVARIRVLGDNICEDVNAEWSKKENVFYRILGLINNNPEDFDREE